ncbi:ATP-binding protein [Dyella jejuensis]|uniref:ATP-binding protein n=1 Tax=Dyella jejuensis TaxID=1432009 RepID=A0ABW8JMQ6_9GAMM
MTVLEQGTHSIRVEQDVVLARQAVRRLAQTCGLRLVDQTKLVTAASELARNTVIYGRGGDMDWTLLEENGRRGLRLHFRDKGPGIADIQKAMTDGWTTGGGLGLGLTGAKRLVSEFELDSAPGAGTRVTITQWA